MKYLYVLVSGEKDYYTEQAFISISTLKFHDSKAFISLLVDTNTKNYIEKEFVNLLSMVNEIKVVDLGDIQNKEKSRLLKTSMREYIDGDFLFLDCDTVICSDLSIIEEQGISDISAVLDNHVLMPKHTFQKNIIMNYKRCGFTELIDKDYHYNSGVIYCRDNEITRKFFSDWHEYWLKGREAGVLIDQPSFNYANLKNKELIQEIPGTWNCQIIHGGIKYLSSAKVLHYFSSINNKYGNPFLINNKEVFEEVRRIKSIPDYVNNIIYTDAKSLFEENCTLYGNNVPRTVIYQAPVRELIWLSKNRPKLYFLFKVLFSLMEKIHEK